MDTAREWTQDELDNMPVASLFPSDLEVELALAGQCLLSPSAAKWAAQNLDPHDFYREAMQDIFSAIQSIAIAGDIVDKVSVSAKLKDRGRYEACGGIEFLSALEGRPPRADISSVKQHAAQLRAMRTSRDLVGVVREAQRIVAQSPRDPQQAIQAVQNGVREITSALSFGVGTAPAAEVAPAFAKYLAELRSTPPGVDGLRTGIANIDRPLGGLGEQRLVLVKGLSKFGKTVFAGQCIFEGCVALKGRPGVIPAYILEGTTEKFLRRWVAWRSGANRGKHLARGGSTATTPAQEHAIQRAVAELHEIPLRVTDKIKTIAGIETDVRNLAMQGPVHGALVDYAQLITGGKGSTEEARYRDVAQRLQILADEIRAPIIVPSQVTIREDGRHTAKGATAFTDNCTLSVEITRGEQGDPMHERIKSDKVDILCDAARDDAPLGLVECIGDFACARIYGPEEWGEAQRARAMERQSQHDN